MNICKRLLLPVFIITSISVIVIACNTEKKKAEPPAKIDYHNFKDSVMKAVETDSTHTKNFFDETGFAPGKDSIKDLLVKMDTQWKRESAFMHRYDSLKKKIKNAPGFSPEEKEIIAENIKAVDSFLFSKRDTTLKDSTAVSTCKEKECLVYAEVDKSKQKLYLWIMGELKDSFLVSTGKGKKHETPVMSLHPDGPVLTKYSSKKFPGGSYLGLGNMPYAVFIRDGYAVHGTTTGNFAKLGTKASHGCIRLHPDNAKVFNALVKSVGIGQTWISVKDSIP